MLRKIKGLSRILEKKEDMSHHTKKTECKVLFNCDQEDNNITWVVILNCPT